MGPPASPKPEPSRVDPPAAHGGTDDTMVEVRGLRAAYGNTVVLHDVSTSVRRGEIHVVLGGSGCGKSTLLRHMLGLEKPVAGMVRLLGQTLTDLDDAGRTSRLRRVGVLFQSGGLFHSMSVADNVAFPLREHTTLPEELIDLIVEQKLGFVGLAHAKALLPGELSGGMKKRAGLARALALEPELLFFDEPSAGLDPVTSSALDDLMVELRDKLGVTLVVVTHELASIDRVADRVTFLAHGQVLGSGTIPELRALGNAEISNFFRRSGGDATEGGGGPRWKVVSEPADLPNR